jgi:uncharacterized protein (DUF952 family)
VIYHIALESDWESALEAGEYRISTLGRTLEDEGFLHAAYGNQVRGVAEALYGGVSEPLVLLTIDERRLTVPLRVDAVHHEEGQADGYPHIYGALDVAAVVMSTPLLRDGQGRLELPDLP